MSAQGELFSAKWTIIEQDLATATIFGEVSEGSGTHESGMSQM